MLIRNNIFSKNIIFLVRDPIISISKINLKKEKKLRIFSPKINLLLMLVD